MKEFRKRPQIATLSTGTKTVYSLFICFFLVSYVVMILLASQRAGWTNQAAREYYAGNELTDSFARTDGELLETVHFHLFSIPVVLLIKTHILLLCTMSDRRRYWLIGGAFGSGLVYVFLPWAIKYQVPLLKEALPVVRTIFLMCLLSLSLIPLWQMWLPKVNASKKTS
jgi:hypothetical protein